MAQSRQFPVTVYKDDESGVYYPNGQYKMINCDHQPNIKTMGITMSGEIVALPSSTQYPVAGLTATNGDAAAVLIAPGTPINPPVVFSDSGFHVVVLIKDNITQARLWVDQAQYNTTVIGNCNPAPYVVSCGNPTGLNVTGLAGTTATIGWTIVPSVVGYEWINNTTSTAPSGDGTFTETSPIALTGLTHLTTYYFWLRAICDGGTKSAWVSISYNTPS